MTPAISTPQDAPLQSPVSDGRGYVTQPWAMWGVNVSSLLRRAGYPAEIDAASGAIGIKNGTVIITKAGIAAMTLALPIAGPLAGSQPNGDDMKELLIFSTSAFAHTVTTSANGFNGNKTTATFAGAAGNFMRVYAYGAVWYVLESAGVTVT